MGITEKNDGDIIDNSWVDEVANAGVATSQASLVTLTGTGSATTGTWTEIGYGSIAQPNSSTRNAGDYFYAGNFAYDVNCESKHAGGTYGPPDQVGSIAHEVGSSAYPLVMTIFGKIDASDNSWIDIRYEMIGVGSSQTSLGSTTYDGPEAITHVYPASSAGSVVGWKAFYVQPRPW